MPYNPRDISLVQAIEVAKERRPFLKQARANVYNQIEQVHVAWVVLCPRSAPSGGYEVFSSPFSTSF